MTTDLNTVIDLARISPDLDKHQAREGIETMNPQPGDKYYERGELAKNPANLGKFNALLADLPLD